MSKWPELEPAPPSGTFTHHEPKPRHVKATVCKHGSTACDKCGTSGVTDMLHTTCNGVGKVGSLQKRKK